MKELEQILNAKRNTIRNAIEYLTFQKYITPTIDANEDNKTWQIIKEVDENEIKNDELYLMHFNMFNKPWRYDGVQNEELFWKSAEKTAFSEKLRSEKDCYDEKKQRGDREAAIKLLRTAQSIAGATDIFFRKKGKILC